MLLSQQKSNGAIVAEISYLCVFGFIKNYALLLSFLNSVFAGLEPFRYYYLLVHLSFFLKKNLHCFGSIYVF